MTKKDRQREEILLHGFRLQRIFNVDENESAVQLAKRVHRLEIRAHRFAEDLCNVLDISEEEQEKREASMFKSLDKILHFRESGIPVFINLDPRGYALKIDSDYVRDHNLEIERDMGGFGILAPEY